MTTPTPDRLTEAVHAAIERIVENELTASRHGRYDLTNRLTNAVVAALADRSEPGELLPAERDIRERHRVVHRPGVHGEESWCDEDHVRQPCDSQVLIGVLTVLREAR